MASSKKLAAYRTKRDFAKTPEPAGATVAKSKLRRFVIQKHAATRLHYDLRLELGGVFKSWAVTRGPSLDPADKRLAVEVEDHPLDYGDFEGTIPKGQYGGGTVMIWDRGYWLAEDAEEGLRNGDLKFALAGEKLQGEFVLVRMKHSRDGGKRTNWLLIKHGDADARTGKANTILDQDRSVASGRTMEEIAEGVGTEPTPFMLRSARGRHLSAAAVWDTRSGLAADLRASGKIAAKSAPKAPRRKSAVTARSPARNPAAKQMAKKAPTSAMPDFIEPQLCRLADTPPSGKGWLHEVKFDGYRIQLRIGDGSAALRTRSGLDWTEKFPKIARVAAKLPDAVLDGEVVALNKEGNPDFATLQAALSDGVTDALVFYAFDLLFLGGEDLRKLPLTERKELLQKLLNKLRGGSKAVIRYVEHFAIDGPAMLETARRMGLEGIVSKKAGASYRSGRGAGWIKTKCRPGHEVVVGGWKTTSGKFRSLMVGVPRDEHLAYVGIVGTGFGRDVVQRISPALKAAAASKSPFGGKNAPMGGRDVHWLKPELVAEIEFAGWTGDGMVRQAAFKGLRADKEAKDVRADKPKLVAMRDLDEETPHTPNKTGLKRTRGAAEASPDGASGAMRTGRRRSPARSATVMGVALSHPDKAFWPDAGDDTPVTKLDLANYFESVGDFLIEHIRGRPCSILRAPDGIDGNVFFQRHAMRGMSPLLTAVTVSGDRKPYLQIDSVEGLIAVAQVGALELHPWNCAPDQPDVPGRLVFDLDPGPDVDFPAVIAAAKELRDRINRLGLEAFCKTTGGKGLHVETPLSAKPRDTVDWSMAKTFAQEICRQMAADAPDRYLTTMAKKDRTGRIFLDYLRNDRMSTAVAVLSPRARPGATVAMPLNWPQVRAGLSPNAFTIRTALAALNKGKPWRDYAKASASLKAAIQKLVG
ncbi:MAG TPA: DNA ligase D [Xanthobacteraceae bacterium]|nr:DNA ligase D [Xanthobacteraceae bacterium]